MSLLMEHRQSIEQLAPEVQGQRVAFAVATTDFFNRRRRLPFAHRVPDQAFESVEGIDHDCFKVM